MQTNRLAEEALHYHRHGRPGKIEVVPTKPYDTQHFLSLAYSPGVAAVSSAVAVDPDSIYDYTNRGNLCAVVSDGSAVLGLGAIGPRAAKPVMEGKAMLFKVLADIDAFDIEIDAPSPRAFIDTVRSMAPTFGCINLEDIKAPECFAIERELIDSLEIPVMHDDQHGTAVIVGAALINALELVGKKIGQVQTVVNGAGAAAIACARFLVALGADRNALVLCDSRGVVRDDRQDLTPEKREFATRLPLRTLGEAVRHADVFIGVSKAGLLDEQMLRSMASSPIVFALANPDPEIDYPLARGIRGDAILATGRSDYPNQVNNVLGFPYIFRAALDTRARRIDRGMMLAAARALAELAREPVPAHVRSIYGADRLEFGRDYLIPKPLDKRLLTVVAPAVAHAASESGSARRLIPSPSGYLAELEWRRERIERFSPALAATFAMR